MDTSFSERVPLSNYCADSSSFREHGNDSLNFRKIEDLSKPINTILERLNYKNIDIKNKLNDIIQNKKLIHNFDDSVDMIILYSIYEYNNLNCFVIFGKNKSNSYKHYTNYYQEDYILYGIKNLKFKVNKQNNIIFKIMYQLLFPRIIMKHKNDLYDFISENYPFLYNYCNFENSENSENIIDITILFICKRNLTKKYPTSDIIEKDHVIFHPNTREEKWHAASIFFCKESLNFIELQNFDFFLIKELEESKKMFLKYRKWIMNNIEPLYQHNFMIFSSTILYLLGHRAMNDLDLYVHTVSPEIQEKLKEFTENKVYSFIDFKVKNTSNWLNYWDTWLDEWAQKSGAKYFEEVLGNSKFHFYFLGVKVISLKCDITRRLIRNRPRAIADLIALRKRYPYQITIPSVPETYLKYIDVSEKSEGEVEELMKLNRAMYNEKNREITFVCETDVNKFINTIIYALQSRFRMQFSVSEIRRELKMPLLENGINDLAHNKIASKYNNTERKKVKIIIKAKN
jgi:hypothetical protein